MGFIIKVCAHRIVTIRYHSFTSLRVSLTLGFGFIDKKGRTLGRGEEYPSCTGELCAIAMLK